MSRSLNADFERLFFERRVYLEPHLTVAEMARRLHTNKTYVSRLVNENYGMSFPNLLNTFRIQYAREYIAAHPDIPLYQVAPACGFTSIALFHLVFKQQTGFTPATFLASLQTQ
jgi:AraC-like DNA-binding protein